MAGVKPLANTKSILEIQDRLKGFDDLDIDDRLNVLSDITKNPNNLTDFKKIAISRNSVMYDASLWKWIAGDFTNVPAERLDRDVVKSQTIDLSVGAWVRSQRSIYAGDFGVRGDRVTDDTAAINNVIAIAKALRIGIVRFGYLRCRITGPIICDSVGLVWDYQGFGGYDPGLYPEGTGYTCVKVFGFVPDFVCGIYSDGVATFDSGNQVLTDTRPNVTGIQISGPNDGEVCALSRFRWVRTVGLRRGVLVQRMWDTNIDKLSVEYCGGTGADDYAIDIQDGGLGQTTNESVISYIQCEHAVHRAIRISPNLLSCYIGKIHSERAWARPGVSTWILGGGSCIYDTLRLDASVNANANAPKGTAYISGASTVFRCYRAENMMTYYSAYQGSSITIEQAAAIFEPAANQNGRVLFRGGTLGVNNSDGYTVFDGTNLLYLSVGYCDPGLKTVAINCNITDLSSVSTQASLDCHSCTITLKTNQTFSSIKFLGGTQVKPSTGTTISFGYQYTLLDVTSVIKADLAVDFAGFDWQGSVEGNVTFTTALRTIVGSDAKATGTVVGYTPPTGAEYIGPMINARRTKNPQWAPGSTPGWLYASSDAKWHPEPIVA